MMAYRLPAEGPESTRLTPAEGWAIAVVATLVMSISYIDRQTFSVLSPTVSAALHLGPAQYGLLAAAFSVAYLAAAPIAGWRMDRAGARGGLIASLLFWSLVSAGHAFAGSFVSLFALRVALGFAESPSFPGAAQAVRRALPPRQRSAGFGMLFTGSSLGAMIAAPLAIFFNRHFGWNFAFLGTAVVGLAWIPVWILVTRHPEARRALAPPSGDQPKPSGRGVLALLGEGAVLRGLLLVLVSAPTMNFALNWLPKYLVAERGLTQDSLAAYLWAPPLSFDLGSVGFGILATLRKGVKRDLVLAAATLCATMALMPLAKLPAWTVAFASSSVAGCGALFGLLTADMLARIDGPRVASAGGLCAAAQSIAYVVANVVVGLVLSRTGSYAGVLFTLGALVLPGAIVWTLWPVRALDTRG